MKSGEFGGTFVRWDSRPDDAFQDVIGILELDGAELLAGARETCCSPDCGTRREYLDDELDRKRKQAYHVCCNWKVEVWC